jgi:ankyrin repeat protein
LIEHLASRGAAVDPPNGSPELSALPLASREGNLKLVRYLMSYGADANRRDGEGRSAFHAAIEKGTSDNRQLLIVRLLLEAGSDHST